MNELGTIWGRQVYKKNSLKETNLHPFSKRNQNALVLVPCCKQKSVSPFQGQFQQPLHGLQPLRNQLLQQVQQTPNLAALPQNNQGILNPNAPLTRAVDLYVGKFYQVAGAILRGILTGRYPSVHILIVSAFYGLVRLGEGLKEYELQMGNRLQNGLKVYKFWQQLGLWQILHNYIVFNYIAYVWSLLPVPYHRVFSNLWKALRNTQIHCYHVQAPRAGRSISRIRARWLVDIIRINPNYLIAAPFPPNQLGSIPYNFHYHRC